MARDLGLFQEKAQAAAAKPDVRVTTVNSQMDFENWCVQEGKCPDLSIVFCVPTFVTPAYINPDHIEEVDGLWRVRGAVKETIPEGLLTEEVLQDPKKYSGSRNLDH